MSNVHAAMEQWKQLLSDAQEKYLSDAEAALAVHFDPERPETQAVRASYNIMMRVMLGEGLKLPKGYRVLDQDRLPYIEESD